MSELKVIIINLISAVCGFLMPIHDFMVAVVLLFVMNFICGVTADVVHGDGWSTKKALTFVGHCFIFFGLATFIFASGHFMHNDSGAVQCVSYICYVAFYIYVINIVRNLRSVTLKGSTMYKLLDFVYFVLTLKLLNKIPYLSDYFNCVKSEQEEESGATHNHGDPDGHLAARASRQAAEDNTDILGGRR